MYPIHRPGMNPGPFLCPKTGGPATACLNRSSFTPQLNWLLMGNLADSLYRAVESGIRACPDLAMAMLAVLLDHAVLLEAFVIWCAGEITGDIFMVLLLAALGAWVWPMLPPTIRRALEAGRDTFVPGRVGQVRGKMPTVDERGSEDFYTVLEAERLLSRTDKPISERRIRQMLSAGELEGWKDEAGRWHVAQHEVHRLMRERRHTDPQEVAGSLENADALLNRVFMLEREIGRLQGRLELEERAESTVGEERDRLLEERDRERERADRLEAELAESRRGFWRRLFGG
jgi:hypothetical protein